MITTDPNVDTLLILLWLMMKETLILGPVSDVVSLLGFGIAAISPPVVKSFLYYLKQPCVVVEYNENGLSISNNSSLPIKARMEYLVKIKVQKELPPIRLTICYHPGKVILGRCHKACGNRLKVMMINFSNQILNILFLSAQSWYRIPN